MCFLALDLALGVQLDCGVGNESIAVTFVPESNPVLNSKADS